MIARVVIPALVRGDELITKSGCYGDLIREARRLELEGTAMSAGIMIGNPFTDVPELCCQVVVATAGDEATAKPRPFGWPRSSGRCAIACRANLSRCNARSRRRRRLTGR